MQDPPAVCVCLDMQEHARPSRSRSEPDAAQAPSSGGGRMLPGELKARMERAFAADFSAVRLHEDGAAEAAERLRAHLRHTIENLARIRPLLSRS